MFPLCLQYYLNSTAELPLLVTFFSFTIQILKFSAIFDLKRPKQEEILLSSFSFFHILFAYKF